MTLEYAVSGGTPPVLSSNIEAAYQYLQEAGLTPDAAAGIVGNLMQESNVNPEAVQQGGPGRGIAQWTAGANWNPSLMTGNVTTDLQNQLNRILSDLAGNPSEYDVTALQESQSPQQAAEIFEQYYERPDPAYANTLGREQNALEVYSTSTTDLAQQQTNVVDEAISAAESQVGTPYVWGAEQPNQGFDCSGLVQWAYAQAGVQLPRTTYQQLDVGQPVSPTDPASWQPGDLIFPDPGHVQIYLGGGQVVEAPSPGQSVRITPEWASNIYAVRRPVSSGTFLANSTSGAGLADNIAASNYEKLGTTGSVLQQLDSFLNPNISLLPGWANFVTGGNNVLSGLVEILDRLAVVFVGAVMVYLGVKGFTKGSSISIIAPLQRQQEIELRRTNMGIGAEQEQRKAIQQAQSDESKRIADNEKRRRIQEENEYRHKREEEKERRRQKEQELQERRLKLEEEKERRRVTKVASKMKGRS